MNYSSHVVYLRVKTCYILSRVAIGEWYFLVTLQVSGD